jgi:hypothetical protein
MSNVSRFAAGFGRLPLKSRPYWGQQPQRKPALDRGAMLHFWHPDRPGVEAAPDSVRLALTKIHPKLRCVRPPAGAPIHTGYHPWIVWFENPTITQALSPNWLLVFVWDNPDTHEPLPLDNRLYANCYMRDPRMFKNGLDYFDGCVRTMTREQDRAKATTNDETYQRQKGLRDYQKIKNIGMGNKFALHHDGTNIASRGETDWRTQTLYERLPDEVRQMAEKEGKNTRRRVGVLPGFDAAHARASEEWRQALDTIKLLKERREKVNARFSRVQVGYTGARGR